jgi:hypothetical protein
LPRRAPRPAEKRFALSGFESAREWRRGVRRRVAALEPGPSDRASQYFGPGTSQYRLAAHNTLIILKFYEKPRRPFETNPGHLQDFFVIRRGRHRMQHTAIHEYGPTTVEWRVCQGWSGVGQIARPAQRAVCGLLHRARARGRTDLEYTTIPAPATEHQFATRFPSRRFAAAGALFSRWPDALDRYLEITAAQVLTASRIMI